MNKAEIEFEIFNKNKQKCFCLCNACGTCNDMQLCGKYDTG